MKHGAQASGKHTFQMNFINFIERRRPFIKNNVIFCSKQSEDVYLSMKFYLYIVRLQKTFLKIIFGNKEACPVR